MKNNCRFKTVLSAASLLFALASSSRAGIFTWSAATPITTADTTLGLSGTVTGAEVFGPDEKIVALSNGSTIDFKADGSVAAVTAGGAGTAYGAYTNDSGNAAFNATLTQFNYDGGPKTITLFNLTPGQQYSVQLFGLDQRGGNPSSSVGNFQDPNDASDATANFSMGNSVYFTATFTAPGSSVDIKENLLNSGNGNINALVVRAIGTNLAPQITSQPQPTTVYHGLTAKLSSAATGTGVPSFQWQKSSVGGSLFTNLSNGGSISGATSNTLTIGNLAANDGGDYRLAVSNAYGSAISSPATLTVLSGTPQFSWSAPAAITTADATLNQSGTVVGAVSFGASDILVTLTNSSVIDFTPIGSTGVASLVGGFGTATGAFSGNTGNANFNSVLDSFTYDGGPDDITLNNLFVGQQYSVQLFALDDRSGGGGAAPFRQANFQDINDPYDVSSTFQMGDNVYTIGTFTAASTSVTLRENLPTGNNGNINALVVRALGVIVAPQITTQPQPVTIDQGLTATFTSAASGTAPLTYHWQKSSVGGSTFTNLTNGGRISGATAGTLVISGLVASDAGDYRLVAANAAGSAASSQVTLTVVGTTPKFVWSLPATITSVDATLVQSGTVVGAAVFGPTPKIVVLTNGTSVDFKNDGSVATATGQGITTGSFSGNTGNADFNAVLNQFNYDNGPKTISLSNLVSGQQYSVQLFALDDRSGSGSRSANFQDPSDNNDYSGTFFMPDNVYTMGAFTATGSSINLQENLPNGGGGNINALVVRRLTGLPLAPQITSEPQSISAFTSANVQFTVGATGTALTYQWQRAASGSGVFANVSNNGTVSGATTAQLTIANVRAANAGDYRIIVSNGSGSVTSAPVAMLVLRSPAKLVHRWNFNESSGSVAHDSVGTSDGTLQGGASFNGSGLLVLSNPNQNTANSFVTIPGGLVTGLSAVTFEVWYTNAGLNNGNTLIGFGGPFDGSGNGTNFLSFFARWPSSQTGFQIKTTSGDSGVALLGTRLQNQTVHFTLVYDPGVGTATLYNAGAFYGTASGITIPLSTVGTNLGYIGYAVWNNVIGAAIPTTSGNNPFLNASIDEMRIYDGALSVSAIAATQILGPNQVLANSASLNIVKSGSNYILTWPVAGGAFIPETSAVLDSNAVWTAVSGTKSVVGSNYQMTVPAGSGAAYFRLRQ